MPTNPMFAKFDQALGVEKPTVVGGTSTRADEIRALASKTQTEEANNSYGGFGGVAHDIGTDLNKRVDTTAGIEGSHDNPLSKTLQTAGQGFGAVNDVVGDVVKSAIKPEVLQAAGEKLHPLIEAAKSNPVGQKIINWWADLEQSHPEVARNLEATGNIASLLSYAVGSGEAKVGAETAIQAAKDTLPGVVKPLTEKATATTAAVKDSAMNAKDNVTGLGTKSFTDVYTNHAQSTKALGNALKSNTIVKDGKTISPIDTMQSYEATPKIIAKSNGGHGLDFSAVKEEAAANSKEANKAVDAQIKDMQQLKPFAFSKKSVMGEALDAASKDKEIVRTASLPGVQHNIKQIFEDYSLKSDTITPEQLNEFRKGANQASQAYYNAQRVAATAGAIPKDVADRAQAFAVLGDVFRDKLVQFDPTLDTLLTTQRVHNAVQQYASRAHLSAVGTSGLAKKAIDATGSGVGALVGSTLGPAGTVGGAVAGGLLTEKAQNMLLRRTYEGARKVSQSTPETLDATTPELQGSLEPIQSPKSSSETVPHTSEKSKAK